MRRAFAIALVLVACRKQEPAKEAPSASAAAAAVSLKPPASTAALSGVLPKDTLQKLRHRPKHAKGAKKKHKGMYVEAVPKSAAKAGKTKAARPLKGRAARAPIKKDGSFALEVPAADYLLVFYDEYDLPIGTYGYPMAASGRSSSLLPFSRAPAKAGGVLNVNLGSIYVDASSWSFTSEINPLVYVDRDGDGDNDWVDLDDDGDGENDVADLDADGDGVDDTLFDFDADDDGQLDLFDTDDDNDGVEDIADLDDDGDGVDDVGDADNDGFDDSIAEAAVDEAPSDYEDPGYADYAEAEPEARDEPDMQETAAQAEDL